ncbi:MAG: hypothetical protein H8E74_01455 [Gammaproteobacteria bacterium]|nr:hypothetical protein [Gammaproteobacteria bacterium]
MFLLFALYRGYWFAKSLYFGPLPKHVWVFWQDPPDSKQPGYITLCLRSIIKNNQHKLQVHVLDEHSIYNYLPNLRKDLVTKLSLPQRADYYRVALLLHYGGIWLDADTVVMRNLTPLLQLLRYNEFVGFGCHYSAEKCKTSFNGYPLPANWVMVARANSELFNRYKQVLDQMINTHDKEYFKNNYHAIGREMLRESVVYMQKKQPFWDYKHVTSRCYERDSSGVKWENKRFISNENIDANCLPDFMFVPVYNTSPGFPEWFRNMSAEEILKTNYLFAKMLRFALAVDNKTMHAS